MWQYHLLPVTPTYAIEWDEIFLDFEILSLLKDVPQDKVYHQEGDVLTHTHMVVEALVKLKDWQIVSDSEKSLVFLSTILHDCGKLFTTKKEFGGIISSRNHSIAGEKLARQLLWKGTPFSVPFNEREQIVKMIRYHGIPLNIWDKKNPKKTAILTSQFVNNNLLSLVAEADGLGRVCKDRQGLSERVLLFRDLCGELNCLNEPFSFQSEHHRYNYLASDNVYIDYIPFDDFEFQVILMSGLPGVGKDHYIKENLSGLPVISLDEIRNELKVSPTDNQGRVIQRAKERTKDLLRNKKDFIFNATNISKELRGAWITLFRKYNARIKIIYVETDYKNLITRNATRDKGLPKAKLEKLINKLEIPDITEAHSIEYVV